MSMLSVGDKVYFMRGRERCEGFCVVQSIDPITRKVDLSPMPEGIQPGDVMVFESEMDIQEAKERYGITTRRV